MGTPSFLYILTILPFNTNIGRSDEANAPSQPPSFH